MRRILAALAILAGAISPGDGAHAQAGIPPDNAPKVIAGFVPESREIRPGGTVTVILREEIRAGWHTYWVNPGDSGAPTAISWNMPQG